MLSYFYQNLDSIKSGLEIIRFHVKWRIPERKNRWITEKWKRLFVKIFQSRWIDRFRRCRIGQKGNLWHWICWVGNSSNIVFRFPNFFARIAQNFINRIQNCQAFILNLFICGCGKTTTTSTTTPSTTTATPWKIIIPNDN